MPRPCPCAAPQAADPAWRSQQTPTHLPTAPPLLHQAVSDPASLMSGAALRRYAWVALVDPLLSTTQPRAHDAADAAGDAAAAPGGGELPPHGGGAASAAAAATPTGGLLPAASEEECEWRSLQLYDGGGSGTAG